MRTIRGFRKKKGLTQRQLAKIVGVSHSSIAMYETGDREAPVDVLAKIAIVLDTTVDELIEFRKIHDEIGNELLEKIRKVKEPIN